MISRGSLWLPLAVLLLLAALSFWIERSVQVTPSGDQATQTDPEGIMENFDALRTDPTGKPHYRLTAARLKHYSGSKLTELESPRFTQLDVEAGEVSAVAQQATVSPDGKVIRIAGTRPITIDPGITATVSGLLCPDPGSTSVDSEITIEATSALFSCKVTARATGTL